MHGREFRRFRVAAVDFHFIERVAPLRGTPESEHSDVAGLLQRQRDRLFAALRVLRFIDVAPRAAVVRELQFVGCGVASSQRSTTSVKARRSPRSTSIHWSSLYSLAQRLESLPSVRAPAPAPSGDEEDAFTGRLRARLPSEKFRSNRLRAVLAASETLSCCVNCGRSRPSRS